MLWTTQSASLSKWAYVAGCRISPFSHETEDDHGGGSAEEVIVDQAGVPERESEIVVQEREAADLHIREPAR